MGVFLFFGIVGIFMMTINMIMKTRGKREAKARQVLAPILGGIDPKSPEGVRILQDRVNALAEAFMQGRISDAEVAESNRIRHALTVLEIDI